MRPRRDAKARTFPHTPRYTSGGVQAKKSTSVSNDLILAKSGFVKLQKNIAPQIVWQLFLNGSHNFYNHISGRELINMLGCNCFWNIYSSFASRFLGKTKQKLIFDIIRNQNFKTLSFLYFLVQIFLLLLFRDHFFWVITLGEFFCSIS